MDSKELIKKFLHIVNSLSEYVPEYKMQVCRLDDLLESLWALEEELVDEKDFLNIKDDSDALIKRANNYGELWVGTKHERQAAKVGFYKGALWQLKKIEQEIQSLIESFPAPRTYEHVHCVMGLEELLKRIKNGRSI